jgi:DNA-binding transcriptional MerR regulator
MLTIGQLAAHAGVTVRHYHAKGLLPEPERDASGYRRYDAKAVVDLIKIRTLADAGVPLARVEELLHADDAQFASAVAEIDERLRAEIRERKRHRSGSPGSRRATAWRCRPRPSRTWIGCASSACRSG